jgi:hypothetical protein
MKSTKIRTTQLIMISQYAFKLVFNSNPQDKEYMTAKEN